MKPTAVPSLADRDWSVLFLFCLFWTVAPIFVIPNYRPDVMEMILVGQNWVLATPKHGSLTCWILEVVYNLTGRAAVAPYLTSQICVFLSLAGVGVMSKRYLPPKGAVLATFCMMSYYFFHFESTLYNNNTTLGLFWIWTAYFGLRSVETNQKRWWLLTGIALGLGIYCKMSIVFLAFSIVFYLLIRSPRRWLSAGPWLTTAAAVILYLPLLKWNINHDFVQFIYAFNKGSANKIPSLFGHFAAPFVFLAKQFLYAAPISVPLIPLLFPRKKHAVSETFKVSVNTETPPEIRSVRLSYLHFIFLSPIGIEVIFALISASPPSGANGCILWYFFPLLVLAHLKFDTESRPFRTAGIISLAEAGIIMILFILGVFLAPAIEGHASRYHFPGKTLAEAVTRLWREKFNTPVPFVIGDEWLTENVSVYCTDRPRLWDPLWAAEDEFLQAGGVLLWEEGNPNSMKRKAEAESRFPNDGEIISLTLPQQTPFKVPAARVNVRFYPPAENQIPPEKRGESSPSS
ncbi:MAG: glycosyltransferase family 39 protein [Thermoguttaceae bacterium]|nr:glycosyltransferase family 39 protein [Thermoguttaceae bacterium]